MTDRIAAARAMLAPRQDPALAGQVLAARAMLGDRDARAEYGYAGAPRSSRDLLVLPGARPTYRCSCGHSNDRNASGRGQSIR